MTRSINHRLKFANKTNCIGYEPVIVKMDLQKLDPPGTNCMIYKNPWNAFYFKILTPSEKFGPPLTDEIR